jgi:hypothetical protein
VYQKPVRRAAFPLEHLVEEYTLASLAPHSRTVYASAFGLFMAWCSQQKPRRCAMPATPSTVASYLVARAAAGSRPGTLEVALISIAHAHRRRGEPWRMTPRLADVMARLRGTKGGARLLVERTRDAEARLEFQKLVKALGGQRAAAKKLRCSSAAVAAWKTGRRGLPFDVLARARASINASCRS